MTEQSGPPLADTSDMINLHSVFRQAFGGAAPLLGDGTEVDPGRVEIVAATTTTSCVCCRLITPGKTCW
jgi:hypothetical protein